MKNLLVLIAGIILNNNLLAENKSSIVTTGDIFKNLNVGDYVEVVVDNSYFEGPITDLSPDFITIKTEQGDELRLKKIIISKISKIKPYSKYYPTVGVTYGNPATINLFLEYSIDRFFGRISGLYYYYSYGVQGNLGYLFVRERTSEMGISLIYSYQDNQDTGIMQKAGIGAHVSIAKFFAELDALYNITSKGPEVTGQIGFCYAFKN